MERVLHHSFEVGLAGELASVPVLATEVAEESSSHALVPVLSLLFVALGALPAYYLYVGRKASPRSLLESHSPLQAFYTFFWNRWFIDAFYNRVFVDGTKRVASFVADDIEASWDRVVHRKLPLLFTQSAERLLRRLRTETEELVYNVSYVLVLFILFLTILFIRKGGG